MSTCSPAAVAALAAAQDTKSHLRNANRAVFLGGFATFAMLNCVQPLLPLFTAEFHVSPMHSSWAMSISTIALAVCLLLSSVMSDRLGRTATMTVALFVSAIATIACAAVGGFGQLLALRGILGVALAGLPAVAMAYLTEEVEAKSLGAAMGQYIAGAALGGMLGRVAASVLADHFSWRAAMAVIGVVALLMAFEFRRRLPPSRNFRPRDIDFPGAAAAAVRHLQDEGLPKLFMIAFLMMGAFVAVYNYLGFRLLDPRFGLSQTVLSFIFTLYVVGMFSSVAMGKLADRLGRRQVLWMAVATTLAGLLLTLADSLLVILPGLALFTFGFFGAHSIASSWVGRRATEYRSLASAIYLFCYYLGGSLIGPLGGALWEVDGWTGIVIVLSVCIGFCLLLALSLRRLPLKT
ncbi:MFS transporter [Noviherbaspirillum sp. UKPF54]|uniref:MFS transporter n=1 Tax=Noviherbaspirillum sp. UKPF54 TaxID=2601898 RepID=UPI0011B147C1|nr:MFS transporter [Noviherbaspirillum sp. UKPF54]QDZ29369.1 MFS transporter [Noviherbaspirillum sp. UKPF54]